MTQDDATRTVGYQLKRVQAALRAVMDAALRAHGLTTPQYVCLELLGRQPQLSNAELARGAFVTRQSMNVVLRNLEEAGLVTRPATAPSGRALPTRLTEAGERVLEAARADVLAIERRMTSGLGRAETEVLLRQLDGMAEALSGPE
ncbi:MarR family winged helix-turn-helix transcriptional regulator [Nonomuraea gerenzanensis]|uniref:Transcriptional regulator, MarR family n=1 Tax=Nonomuraea gerenzanensis TaxID=93944 RepID=A0A1M4EK92_9ACTN|nr:MarR family transcriptional regulator [Nonomuraea gerenzanensis]UBU10855.1 MarR family transcriptional regulator [Nonomuraea gerenzanensis]SBO99291.1 Transcriptional regulator, MarR family [Nonomuraea gerenzanensis]